MKKLLAALLAALAVALLPQAPAGASLVSPSRLSDCWSQGTVAGYVGVGPGWGLELNLGTEDEFYEYVCRKRGHRFYLVVADTPSEVAGLRGWYDDGRGWRQPVALCRTRSGGAYMVWSLGEVWGYRVPTEAENRSYDRWLPRHARRHDCSVA